MSVLFVLLVFIGLVDCMNWEIINSVSTETPSLVFEDIKYYGAANVAKAQNKFGNVVD